MKIKYTIPNKAITKAHKFMNYTYTCHSISPTCFNTLGHLQGNTIPIHVHTCICVCVYIYIYIWGNLMLSDNQWIEY